MYNRVKAMLTLSIMVLCLTGCDARTSIVDIVTGKENDKHGSLTLCFSIDFHNPLQHSPLRLIFLSIFSFFSVLFCTLVV